MADTEDYEEGGTAGVHHTTHEDGGSDEVLVTGLSGTLADPQTPAAHKTSHQDAGADEISVTGLSGLLATAQIPVAHAITHEDGGSDELILTGMVGLLATAQTPAAHKTSHQDVGADEISVTGLSGLLADDQHVIDAEVTAAAATVKLDDFAAPDDNTDLNTSTTKHGLAPKGTVGTTQFWRQDWTLATPAGGTPTRRIIIPAAAFETRVAAGWAAFIQTQGTNLDYGELDFDKDTDEKAISPPFVMENYDGGNVTTKIYWKANATAGTVRWLAGVLARTDDEAWDAALATEATIEDDAGNVAEDIMVASSADDWSSTVSADDIVNISITRDADHANDDLAVDAKLICVMIEYTEA